MNGSSIAYHQRQYKNIDRLLLLEILNRINRYIKIFEYSYIGFGGSYLEDFKLIHMSLGLNKLISIEKNSNTYLRQKFNQPLECINCHKISSSDYIAEYNIKGNAIIWLDYVRPAELREQLGEIQTLIKKLIPGDILKVTFNANPDSLARFTSDDEQRKANATFEIRRKRFEVLKDRIGDYLPYETSEIEMTLKDLPKVLLESFRNVIYEAMEGKMGEIFHPLTAFSYIDHTHQMLTITGILLEEEKIQKFNHDTQLEEWPLILKGWNQVKNITVPSLSVKEKIEIDRLLPSANAKELQEKLGFNLADTASQSKELLENYALLYRHYPNFHKVVF